MEQLENNDTLLNIGSTIAEKLQNLQRIIDPMATGVPSGAPSVQEVRVSEKYCSRTLTTWRKLWIERDSMERIPEEERWIKGSVIKETLMFKEDAKGNKYARFSGDFLKYYKAADQENDEFEGGELFFNVVNEQSEMNNIFSANVGCFNIMRSDNCETGIVADATFEIWPQPTLAQWQILQEASAVYFTAKDDGDYSVFDSAVVLSMGSYISEYQKAYISPIYADKFNKDATLPYKRAINRIDVHTTLNKSRNLKESSLWMWTTYALAAFEPSSFIAGIWGIYFDLDHDPDGFKSLYKTYDDLPYEGSLSVLSEANQPMKGATPWFMNMSLIFLEVLRDENVTQDDQTPLDKLTIHEITHAGGAFGIPHEVDGYLTEGKPMLMTPDPNFKNGKTFGEKTIRDLRVLGYW